jgi:hypothetical protein
VRHGDAERGGGDLVGRTVGENLRKAAEGCAEVEHGGRGEDAGPVGDVSLLGTLAPDVALHGGGGEAVLVAELVAMLEREHGVEAVLIAGEVVPAAHGLVVGVLTVVAGGEEVLGFAGVVGHGVEVEDLLADGADAVGGNEIAGERIANVSTEATGSLGGIDAGNALTNGERIEDIDAVCGEVSAGAEIGRRRVGDQGKGTRSRKPSKLRK